MLSKAGHQLLALLMLLLLNVVAESPTNLFVLLYKGRGYRDTKIAVSWAATHRPQFKIKAEALLISIASCGSKVVRYIFVNIITGKF